MKKIHLIILFLLFSTASFAQQIPNLDAIDAVANGDLYYCVDVSDTTDGASGTGKKCTTAQLKTAIDTDTDTTCDGSSCNVTNTGTLDGYEAAALLDNTDTQDLDLTGNTLSLTDGGSVDLSGYLDNTDAQDLTLTTNTLAISGDPNTDVDLSGYLDNTDDQTIDVLSFDGTNISISLESDGEATKTLDISSVDTDTTYTAGTNISLDGTTFNVDDSFLSNTGDTSTGDYTFDGTIVASAYYGDGQYLTNVSGGVSDGDKGDITVSDSGTTWSINTGVVGSDELASTAVTPGSYTNTNLTVDADGRITAASNGSTGGSVDQIVEGDTLAEVVDAGDGYFYIQEDGTEYVRLTGGNFGIGTSVPSEKFDVVGNINATGNVTADGTMVATAYYGDGSNLTGITTSETNSLETTITGIQNNEIFIGDGANSGNFRLMSGDATLSSTGSITLASTQAGITTAANLTTVGTIGTGVWQGTAIDQTYLVGQSGTNTGDQTSIVGITGTTEQFNTANTDGDFAISGGAFHDGFSDFVANEHIDWTTDQGATNIDPGNYTDTDTTYTASGTLLDLTSTTFSVNEGTLTDTKYCTYESGVGLVCNSEGGSGTTISGLTDNYVTKANGTDNIQNSNIYDDDTNVGIGTTNPSGKLDIEGGDVYIGTGTFNNTSSGDDLYVTGNLEVDGSLYGDGSQLTGLSSGFADPMTTRGDMIYRNSSNATARLPVGTNGQVLTTDGTDVSWGTASGGSANFSWVIEPQQMKLASSDPGVIDAGTDRWRMLFDDTTPESATSEYVLQPYTGTLKAKIFYTMLSATSGTVEFELSIDCFSDGDTADFDTVSFGTADSLTATVPGTAGYLDVITDTSLNGDSCSAGDFIAVKIERDADDATNDTSSGDAELRKVYIYAE